MDKAMRDRWLVIAKSIAEGPDPSYEQLQARLPRLLRDGLARDLREMIGAGWIQRYVPPGRPEVRFRIRGWPPTRPKSRELEDVCAWLDEPMAHPEKWAHQVDQA